MERTLDFSSVVNYALNFDGHNLVLKLIQDGLVTNIRVYGSQCDSAIESTLDPPMGDTKRVHVKKTVARVPLTRKSPIKSIPHKSEPEQFGAKTATLTRLNETQVKEIRANWEDTVRACGGKKGEAAKQLAAVYNCSYKNIYAIIYRYSWSHV